MHRNFSGLWRHPDFMKLWIGQSISEFGSHITGTGLPLVAVITLAASPSELGVLAALSSIPILLFSLVAGVWVDRLPRRPIMIFADVARLLLLLTVPLAAFTGHLNMALVYIVTVALSLLTLLFNVAYRAVLPGLISREHLLEGNTKLATSSSLAEVGGPSIAGALIQAISAPVAIIFDALTFLISAISVGLIRQPEPPPATRSGESMLGEVRAGFGVIMHHPILRALVIGNTARAFFGNFYAALYSLFVIRELGLSAVTLGVIVSAGGIGALVGAVLAQRVTKRFGLGYMLAVLPLITSPLGLLTPLAGGSPLLAAGMLIFTQIVGDALWSIYGINEISLQQTLVPDHLLGRANASAGFLAQGIAPAGALVAGFIASFTSVRFTLLIAVIGSCAVSLWMVTTPVRRLESHPEAPQPEAAPQI
jgi:MFS family permease